MLPCRLTIATLPSLHLLYMSDIYALQGLIAQTKGRRTCCRGGRLPVRGFVCSSTPTKTSPCDAQSCSRLLKCIFQMAGLRLLGFKPLTSLADYHQLRSSFFLYPDEHALPGSATAFIALHARLLERSMYALCCLVRSRVAEPRLVALLPQEELLDEAEMQVALAGVRPACPYLDQCDDHHVH